MKVCWDEREDRARVTAHRRWPNEQIPGELSQMLPTPKHFEQASKLVTEEMVADALPCGPDLGRHVQEIERYADAGFDEVYVHQIGGADERFFDAYAREVLPRFAESAGARTAPETLAGGIGR
jgi:hypothetical protein